MKNLISGILAVALVAGPASAQQVPTAKLPQVTVKLNGASGGGSGDITAVDIATTAPLTGGATCATGACSFTLGIGAISLTTGVTGILPAANGGTGNGFTLFSGPATSEKTFTLPNASATILTGTPTIGAVPYLSATGIMSDTPLVRESADVMSQRNGTAAQESQLYATYSGAGANYERLFFRPVSTSLFRIGSEKAGTGGTRQIRIAVDGTDYLSISSSGVNAAVGPLFPAADTQNLGTTAALWGHVYNARGQQGSKSKALVDATATNLWQVAVASNSYEGLTLDYTIYATDGSDRQVRAGSVTVAILNNGGTETCVFGTATDAVNTSAGTLTVTWDCTAGTDTVMIRATADTSLASTTTFTAESRPNLTSGTATVTPQ